MVVMGGSQAFSANALSAKKILRILRGRGGIFCHSNKSSAQVQRKLHTHREMCKSEWILSRSQYCCILITTDPPSAFLHPFCCFLNSSHIRYSRSFRIFHNTIWWLYDVMCVVFLEFAVNNNVIVDVHDEDRLLTRMLQSIIDVAVTFPPPNVLLTVKFHVIGLLVA